MYSNTTLPPPGSLPILPPPHNAGPSPVTPTYSDRSDSHNHNNCIDYNTHSYFHQPATASAPIYPRPSAEHPVSSYEYERRPSDSRPRASYGNYGTNAYSTAPYPPSPYSPQARGYSPASSGSLGSAGSYHSQGRQVQSPTYPSRGLRLPSSTYNASVAQRRLESTQAHLPPITNVYPEPHSHIPTHVQMEEGRNVSRTERRNGQDYTGEQYQPPPPPNSWYLQDNNNGYGNEGYRG